MEKVWRAAVLCLVSSCAIELVVTPAISQSSSQHESTKKTGLPSVEQIWKSLMDGNQGVLAFCKALPLRDDVVGCHFSFNEALVAGH